MTTTPQDANNINELTVSTAGPRAGDAPAPAPAPTSRRRRLPAPAAFYLLASIVLFFLAGSSAPTPLYATYQARWGFSPITVTVVFAVYALAVLTALLTVGSLSDHVGRRPVLFAAIVMQAVAMLVFASAGGVTALVVARIVQGLSTGAAAGAVGAGMLDIDRTKGTIANAVAPITGTATGSLLSGLMVQHLPAPTRLVYLVLLAIFIAQAVGVVLMPESSARKPGALASLRPRLRVPAAVRRPLALAVPALVATWALAEFDGSLGPMLVRRLAHSTSFTVAGLTVFVMAASGAIAVLLLRSRAQRTLMIFGASALMAGVGMALLAIDVAGAGAAATGGRAAVAAFFVGTALSGVGFGAAFQGAIRSVLLPALPHERAGVLSVVYVVSYLAMGLPAVAAGVLVAQGGGGVLATARDYGVVVMTLAALALLGALVGRRFGHPAGNRAAIAPVVASST